MIYDLYEKLGPMRTIITMRFPTDKISKTAETSKKKSFYASRFDHFSTKTLNQPYNCIRPKQLFLFTVLARLHASAQWPTF